MKILSVHLPSNRPPFFHRLVEGLAKNAADRSSFEVVVKIDEGDAAMAAEVETLRREFGVAITTVVSPPPRDYFDMSRFYNDIFAAASTAAYFCWHVNDEVIVESEQWDNLLRRYVGFFKDDLFRLKISPDKMFRNILDIHDVNLYADFPITTRRWLDLTDGWVQGHGPEPYQEGISFLLAQRGIHRNVPLPDFHVAGDEPGRNIDPARAGIREQRMCLHWDQNMEPGLREIMTRCARRIELCITAANMGLSGYTLQENIPGKYISLVASDRSVASRLWYQVDPLRIHWENLKFVARRNEQVWPFSLWGKPWWYKVLVYIVRFGDRVGGVLFLVIYLPLAGIFGTPTRCWWAQALERKIVRHWHLLMKVADFLKRRMPRLYRYVSRCFRSAQKQGRLS